MKALVTGGCGFIGAHIVRALLGRGDEVVVIDNFSTGSRDKVHSGSELIEGDIRDRDLLEDIFGKGGFEAVFHTAALARIQPSVEDPLTTHDVNVTGTLNLLRAAATNKVRKFVYSSSSSIYGPGHQPPFDESMLPEPPNPYALQKWMGEEWCRLFSSIYGLDTVCLRYFNVYGPGMIDEGAYRTVISIFLKQKGAGEKLTITGSGEQRRDFTHVNDIVAGNLAAADSDRSWEGAAFNLGYGQSFSVLQVAEGILKDGEGNWRDKIEFISERPHEVYETLAANQKARTLLGWRPEVPFEKGLEELL